MSIIEGSPRGTVTIVDRDSITVIKRTEIARLLKHGAYSIHINYYSPAPKSELFLGENQGATRDAIYDSIATEDVDIIWIGSKGQWLRTPDKDPLHGNQLTTKSTVMDNDP